MSEENINPIISNQNNDLYDKPENISPIVNPNESFTQSKAPKGTSYNKKTTLLVGMIIALSLGFFLITGLMSQPKKTEEIPAQISDQNQTDQNIENLTPDELEQMPSSYRKNNENYPNQLSNNQPGEYYQNGSPNRYNQYGYNVEPPRITRDNYSSDVPRPPEIEPVIVSEAVKGPTPEQQEKMNIRKSQIRLMQNTTNNSASPNKEVDPVASHMDKMLSLLDTGNNQQVPVGNTQKSDDPNGQDNKIQFQNQKRDLKFYSSSSLLAPLSKYEIKAGTIIPVTLITGINSDLPGNIICQVRENVFDTVSGKYLLIPQGAKVIGVYDSKISYGQSRVLVIWTRMILPNGKSFDLESMSAVDGNGYTGLKDKVNNHYGKLVSGIFVSSALAWGAKKATDGAPEDDPFAQSISENVTNVSSKITEKNLGIQPTIEIKPGTRFNLFVDKDFILERYK